MMLAELTGLETGGLVCSIVFGGVGMIIGATALFKKQEVQVEQPLAVEFVEQFVSKQEFATHVQGANREMHQLREILRVEIPEMERRIAQAGEIRVEKIHNRINEVLAEVSKVEGMISRDHGI